MKHAAAVNKELEEEETEVVVDRKAFSGREKSGRNLAYGGRNKPSRTKDVGFKIWPY